MAQWYVARNGQQQGPFDENTFRQMIARHEIGRDDTVWTESMSNWIAAGHVPELASLFVAEPQPQTIAYSRPFSDGGQTMLTERALQMLLKTRPWVRIVSVMIFVIAGLMTVAAVVIMLGGLIGAGATGSGSGGIFIGAAGIFVGLFYLVIAALYVMPGLYLSRYASRITSLERMRREDQLEQALEAQKSFWKFIGIAFLVMIGLWLSMVLFMVVAGVAGTSFSSPSRQPTFTPNFTPGPTLPAPPIPSPPPTPVP